MTKEQKIVELINIRDNFNYLLTPREVFDDAIKALEQESVLDKIRAEIAEYGSIRVAYAITDETYTDKGIEELVTDVLSEAKRQMLCIIDKYKVEMENNK